MEEEKEIPEEVIANLLELFAKEGKTAEQALEDLFFVIGKEMPKFAIESVEKKRLILRETASVLQNRAHIAAGPVVSQIWHLRAAQRAF